MAEFSLEDLSVMREDRSKKNITYVSDKTMPNEVMNKEPNILKIGFMFLFLSMALFHLPFLC